MFLLGAHFRFQFALRHLPHLPMDDERPNDHTWYTSRSSIHWYWYHTYVALCASPPTLHVLRAALLTLHTWHFILWPLLKSRNHDAPSVLFCSCTYIPWYHFLSYRQIFIATISCSFCYLDISTATTLYDTCTDISQPVLYMT